MRMLPASSVALTAWIAVLFPPQPSWAADNDVILTWNDLALDTVRLQRLGTPDAARLYAWVNVAMYDAVGGIEEAADAEDAREAALVPAAFCRDGQRFVAPADGDAIVAASMAAFTVLNGTGYVTRPELVNAFNQAMNDTLNARNPFPGVGSGRSWGQFVGEEVLRRRATDIDLDQPWVVRQSTPFVSAVDGLPLSFTRTFGSADVRGLIPLGVVDPGAYLAGGPPDPTSLAYADALEEVARFGRRSELNPAFTPEENQSFDDIFRFWAGSGGTARPPGEWVKVARLLSDQEGTDLPTTAHLFAQLTIAMHDAVAVAWNNKFQYDFWRPATAIQNADRDGNPRTAADPTFVQRNGSIGGSPEYTSGQSTFAGAASTVLANAFGDGVTFTFVGDPCRDGSCPARTFTSLTQAAEEAGRARIVAGIHFEFSNQEGLQSGRALATEVLEETLQPLD